MFLDEGNLMQELVSDNEINEFLEEFEESLVLSKNNIKKLNKKELKNKKELELVDMDTQLMESSLYFNEEVLNEGAKFSIMPKFKSLCEKYPEMGQHKVVLEDAEKIIRENCEPTKSDGLKAGRCALRVLGIFESLNSVVILPACILIFPIFYLLIYRCFKFLSEVGEFALAKKQTQIAIAQLNKVKSKTNDPQVKKKCDEQIKKLEKNLEKLNEDVDFEVFEYMLDEELEIGTEEPLFEGFDYQEEEESSLFDI